MNMAKRWMGVVLGLIVVAAFATPRAQTLWRAQHVLRRLEDRLAVTTTTATTAQGVTPQESDAIAREDLVLTEAHGPLRARLYRSKQPGARQPARGVVLAHGVHYRGIDEKRLVALASALAEAGVVVLTPELDDLTDYRITLRSKHQIAGAIQYLAGRSDLSLLNKIGVLGISFAGGLSLLAAADPDVESKLAWVMSMGGYHDLSRVLQFFARNQIASPEGGIERQASEYGLVVLVYGNLERFVPEQERNLVQEAMKAWLHEDRETARALSGRFLLPESRLLFERLESQHLGELRPEVERILVDKATDLEDLSPHGKLRQIPCPVYLLHGKGDSLIPAAETEWADLELGAHDHNALISPVIDHAEVDRTPSMRERLALVWFMAALLSP